MSKHPEGEFDSQYLKLNDSKRKLEWFKITAIIAVVAIVLTFLIVPYGVPIPDYEKNIYNTLGTYTIFTFLAFGYISTVLYYRNKLNKQQ